MALFMGRLHTGCMDTMVLRGSYHGASPSTMGLTSRGDWYYNYPSAISVHKVWKLIDLGFSKRSKQA